ncbi:DNA-binding beta-propeller fold protein YncE [Sphingomonas leidyi]|uniref:DNA-binding beta-propeller fold protein YncE n=1 Tax=Sphingomonas leidyi TaxID=68569 RepID=A0A7X5ZW70_9SPHN|nr:YncE family protein [Sphingomonas leidyi]NIJ65128.1 DNA-binding beta-propeller fold protein YncE [Sphingomonas leidyi]
MLAPICSWAQPAMHADYRIVDRIPGADGGWDFASVDPAAGRLYVARSNGIMAVDLSDRKVTAALAPAHRAHAVLPMPGTREIVETDGETGLTRFIDGATGAVTAEVATGAKPDAAFLDPATGLVAVMNAGDGTIALVDPVRHALAGKIQVGGGLEFGVADGKGLGYVNIEDRNAIAVVDLKARRVLKSIALPGCEGPTGLALVANGTRLISACANKVAMIVDVAAAKVAGSFAIGSDPDAVLVDPARGLAFIPCGGTGTLEVVDIGDARHIRHAGTIQTQVGAKTGAIDPRNGRIYLPAATLAAPEAGAKRGKPVPGSFVVLVLAPVRS